MTLSELIAILDESAPFSTQEDYDNSGIQYGHPEKEIKKALICLDITPEVVREAVENTCDVIVSHHPVIFKGLKRITGRHYTEQVLIEAIRRDIALVAVHTNLDASWQGVNFRLAHHLGLSGISVLSPAAGLLKKLVTFCPTAHAGALRAALFAAGAGHIGNYDCCSYNVNGEGTFRAGESANPFVGQLHEVHTEPETRIETVFPAFLEEEVVAALLKNHPYEEVAYDIYALDQAFSRNGAGVLGMLSPAMEEQSFLELLKERLRIPVVRHSPLSGKTIKTVALCGGSGGVLLGKAFEKSADAFVSAELKYNQFMDASGKMLLVDAGHYETEQFTKELLADIIQKKMINFAVLISKTNTNPVKYY